jgi:hypothetical protein
MAPTAWSGSRLTWKLATPRPFTNHSHGRTFHNAVYVHAERSSICAVQSSMAFRWAAVTVVSSIGQWAVRHGSCAVPSPRWGAVTILIISVVLLPSWSCWAKTNAGHIASSKRPTVRTTALQETVVAGFDEEPRNGHFDFSWFAPGTNDTLVPRPWGVALQAYPPAPDPPPESDPPRRPEAEPRPQPAWPYPFPPLQADFINVPGEEFGLRHASFDEARRRRRIDAHTARGYTSMDLLAYEDDDAARIDLYTDRDHLRRVSQEIRDSRKRVRVWLMPDTGNIHHRISYDQWLRKFESFVPAVDGDVDEWCLGLEVDEYWTPDQVRGAVRRLATLTNKWIWLHGGQGRWWDLDWWKGAKEAGQGRVGLFYQAFHEGSGGFTPTDGALDAFAVTAAALDTLKVPAVMWEHTLYRDEQRAIEFSHRALERGSYGYGNGGRSLDRYRRLSPGIVANTRSKQRSAQDWRVRMNGLYRAPPSRPRRRLVGPPSTPYAVVPGREH